MRARDHGVAGRTVLVTGGAGFVGSHLADALVPDNDVRVLDDLSAGRRRYVPGDAELIEGDVRDDATLADAVAGVDLVFHEAAQVSVQRSVEEPAYSHDVNAAATVRLLEAARREDARVVLASSAAVYGQPDSVPVHESDPKTPTSPYGIGKLALDHYARTYEDLYGLDTVALRYFNIYGPRQGGSGYTGVVPAFLDQAHDGGPITVEGDGGQTRDFVHVDDVVRANLLAATTDHVGEAFNVGTGDTTSIRELAETVRDAVDPEVAIEHLAPRDGDVRHSCADVGRARERLDFEPSVSLSDGLAALARRRVTG